MSAPLRYEKANVTILKAILKRRSLLELSGADEELPDCKPTTLTWTNRATKYTGWSVSHEAFTVTIRNTYYGSISLRLHSEHSEANDIRANWTKEYFIEYDYWLCTGQLYT
ncbi:hypothetical protein BGZ89_001761 [Linnemannia elongata]|nr:hypothetical protein BGZ89_001761 [Linnemannia elongata]